jgi:hypothetical protein
MRDPGICLLSAAPLLRLLLPGLRALALVRAGCSRLGQHGSGVVPALLASRYRPVILAMKALPFTRQRVKFQVGPGVYQGGVTVGHFVSMERTWFEKKPCWVRFYRIHVLTGPSSVVGRVVAWDAKFVVPWANLSDSPGEYCLNP